MHASEVLGLSDFASEIQIESAYNSKKSGIAPVHAYYGTEHVEWAYALLKKYMRLYKYSFRPEDIRRYQEDAIERHRRQFGNEPFWAGGVYDEPDEKLRSCGR